MKIWVSGSLAYDRVMDYHGRFADHINPKKIHVLNLSFAVQRLNLSFGGTAGNIAYNLSLLRMPVGIVANLGKDGAEYRGRLQKHNIDLKCLQLLADQFTAGAYIITDRADNQISGFFAGAMSKNSKLPACTKSDWAIIAPDSPANMLRLALHYQKKKTNYIFDPGQQITALSSAYLRQGMKDARIIIGNDYEIDLIMRRSTYRARFGQIVVTTLGEKGSLISTGGNTIKIPAAKPKAVQDPTGAGDAYRAGLIYGIISGYSLEEAGRIASCTAVYAVEKRGTQNHAFNLQNIKKRYFQNFRNKI